MEVISLIPLKILHIKTVTLKNDASSKINNFQKNLLLKEHSWRWRFSILFSILSIIVPVISYSHTWNKKIRKSVWQCIRNFFLNSMMWFSIDEAAFTRFNKGFFQKIHRYTIVYYIMLNFGTLTIFSLILEDFFRRSRGMP